MLVITIHTAQSVSAVFNANYKSQTIFELGNYGVQFFFIISGFLLSSIYGGKHLSTIKESGERLHKVNDYSYLRHRLARIWPLWILFLTIGILQSLFNYGPFTLAQRGKQFSWQEFGHYETSSSSIYVILIALLSGVVFFLWPNPRFEDTVIPGGWSIQSEIFNYFFFLIIRRFNLRLISIPFLSLLCLLTILIESKWITTTNIFVDFIRYGFISNLIWFILGIFIHAVTINFSRFKAKDDPIKIFLKNDYFLFTLIFLFLPFLNSTRGNNLEALKVIPVLFVIGYVLSRISLLGAIVAKLGKFTYFIYFFHFQVLFFLLKIVDKFNPNFEHLIQASDEKGFVIATLFTILLVTSISWLIAQFSWRYFESPIIKKFY